jgi:hypothetical protein
VIGTVTLWPGSPKFEAMQALTGQGEQAGPPQSIPVSCPFRTASVHDGEAHVPPEQTWLWQSAPTVQPFPSAQAPQEPPQSTSVSLPSLVPSEHEDPAWQRPLTQLEPLEQVTKQLPQWFGSVLRSLHALPQSTVPAGQEHSPLKQIPPCGQVNPQVPQLFGSVPRAAQ